MEASQERGRHSWRRGLGLLAVFAMLLPLFSISSATAGAQADRLPWEGLGSGAGNGAPIGAGFEITDSDMAFMLDQLRNMEFHLASYSEAEPCAGIFGPDINQVPTGDATQPIGIRVLDGSCNNLVSAINGTSPDTTRWGAADEPFDLLLTPEYSGAYGSGTTPTIGGGIMDPTPRHASNLVNDQTAENPAAVAAGGVSLDPPEFGLDADDMPVASRELLSIENVAPDGGLSAPFNDQLTFFGQFFDHGLDLTTKAGETVMMPLGCDDPLYDDGANNICDGPPPGGDDPFTNFMAISRAQDGTDPLNKTTPYVDQNQTYSSHPSHQVFLREYGDYDAVNGVLPVTGRLINPLDGAGGPSGEEGMATWDDLQENAEQNLGFILDDRLIDNVPMMLTNPYGLFIPGPARGLPQLVVDDGLGGFTFIEGDLTTPHDIYNDAAGFISTGHGFSIDIAHHAVPGVVSPNGPPVVNCMVGDLQVPDSGAIDLPGTQYDDDHDPCTYDDEMLGHHYQSGDGRVNENIALTAVHHVFHSEHNRLRDQIADIVVGMPAGPDKDEWTAGGGEYLFQAAKLVTEMEYQHLAFEEFARSVSPLTAVFDAYQTDINAAIVSSFANGTYRFGHSMLNDNVRRYEPDGTPSDLSLVEAFLNPPAFLDVNGAVGADEGAGALWRGGTAQVGQEIDEFVVDALRNRLVGIPLDLAAINIARGRENGLPTLNGARAQIQALTSNSAFAPYEDWIDFRFNGLKTPETVVNFVAAYGTHVSITSIDPQGVGATAARRAAAELLVNGGAGEPADRADFLNAAGIYAADKGGLDAVDLWNGGLAEKREFDSGSLLGITHDYIFRFQMEQLQEGDRFYYLHRLGGTNLLTSLEGNSLSELVERNTTAAGLPSNVFSRPDFFFDLTKQVQNPPGAIIDDPATMDYLEPELLIRDLNDGAVEFGPQSISGSEVGNTVGDEHTNWFGSVHNDVIDSGDGDDTLRGNEGDDWIQGDGGGDNIIGGAGDDILLDSSGDDDIKGGPGNDAISGGPGVDLLQGNDGDDLFVPGNDAAEMLAGPGDDLIAPGPTASGSVLGGGDDWAEGGNGGDRFSGDDDNPLHLTLEGGNDVLIGDDGPDRLEGEGGEDIFKATGPSDGLDRYFGLFGFDWLVNSTDSDLGAQGVVQPIQEDRFQETEGLSGTAGDDVLIGTGVVAPSVDPATLEARQRLDVATSVIDGIASIVDGPFFEDGNIILGGGGSDRVTGMGEDDILQGDAWLDVYLWHVPTSTRYDTIADFQNAVFLLPGDPGRMNPGDFDIVREIVPGLPGGDVDTAVYQGPIADYDITEISPTMYEVAHVRGDGGTGLATDDGVDMVTDFEMLEFLDAVMDITPVVPMCNGLVVTINLNVTPGALATGGADVILGTPGPDVISGLGGDDTICGEGGDDTIAGNGGNDTILGDAGADTIFGGDNNDTIFGGADNDTIQGNGGADLINGDAGEDALSGNDGGDTLNGGPDNDMLFGVAGNDTIFGDGGADTILGGADNDTINGGTGDDLISGNGGADLINGDADNDTLYGSTEADTINGGTGLDTILGGTGDDIINGGADRDLLSGNENNDTINGGGGDDDIFGVDGADTLNGDGGMDLILGGNGDDIINGGTENDLLSGNADADTIDGGDGDDEIYGVTGEDTLTGGAGADVILGGPDNDTINSDGDGSIDQVSGNAGTDTCNADPIDNVFLCELP